MSRLYNALVDENRWKVYETDNKNYHSYKLFDKEKEEVYYLKSIIGFEQVLDDEFLVFRRDNYDEFAIDRIKLDKGEKIKLFSNSFSQFHFITDDRILFSHWGNTGPYRCGGIYSIKENTIIEEGKWLDRKAVDVIKDNNGDIKIYLEEDISSYGLNSPKVLFTVDPNTLQPNSLCYSELRDSYIKVNTKEDVNNIIAEDEYYTNIIEEELFNVRNKQLKNAKRRILIKENK